MDPDQIATVTLFSNESIDFEISYVRSTLIHQIRYIEKSGSPPVII